MGAVSAKLNSNNNVLLTCNALNGSLDLSGSFSTIGSVQRFVQKVIASLSSFHFIIQTGSCRVASVVKLEIGRRRFCFL